MKKLLISAAEILVWIFVIISLLVFVLITMSAISAIFDGALFGGLIIELIAFVVSACMLSGAVIMKASQITLRSSTEEESDEN